MARVFVDHVARRLSGGIATGSAAGLSAFVRNTDGSNGAAANLYAAATGGSALTQPINPNALGHYNVWIEEPGRYNLVETIDTVTMPTVYFEAVSADLEWHEVGAAGEPAFANNWVNFGSGWDTAAFARTSEGYVKLKGLVKDGTDEAVIFTLPTGFRPPLDMAWAVDSNTLLGRVNVLDTGEVDPGITSNVYISLNNIIFAPA